MTLIPTDAERSTLLPALEIIVAMLHRTPEERLAVWQEIEEWAMRNKQEAQKALNLSNKTYSSRFGS